MIKINIKIISDTIYFGKGYKHPKIIVDGFQYKLCAKKLGKTRWTCVNYKNSKCNSVLYTHGNEATMFNEHNHPSQNVDYEKLIPKKVKIVRRKEPLRRRF